MVRDGSATGATPFLIWKMPLQHVRTLLERSERRLKRLQRHSDEAFTFELSPSTWDDFTPGKAPFSHPINVAVFSPRRLLKSYILSAVILSRNDSVQTAAMAMETKWQYLQRGWSNEYSPSGDLVELLQARSAERL
jgi:hypothetical protein